MQGVMAFFVGIGLSATCGFRIFVPLLGMSIAHHTGHITLSHGFEWIGSWTATIAFAVAMIVEVIAYYIPWVDNLLDTIATPAAVVAGVITTASVVGDGIHALLRLSLELAACPKGLILLEEPEIHQHPAAHLYTAKAVVGAIAQGLQIVLTTHSLELIDALIEACNERELDWLSVHRLKLDDGKLAVSTVSGSDARFARRQIEDDLR